MLRCNLSVLLAEQNLKITKVSKDTGISRTTLTALANNYGQGIQFDTINKLCLYLRVGPEQLLSFVPVDIKIKNLPMNNENIIKYKNSNSEIEVTVTDRSKSYNCNIFGNIIVDVNRDEIFHITLDMELWNPDDNEHIRAQLEEENKILINAFKQLTRPFITDLEINIFEQLIDQLEYTYQNAEGDPEKIVVSNDVDFSCNWPVELIVI